MHLFSYMRRNTTHTTEYVDEKQLIVNAIERNFGGTRYMHDVVQCIFPVECKEHFIYVHYSLCICHACSGEDFSTVDT